MNIFIVEGTSNLTAWNILRIFNNYPSAVKYASKMETNPEWQRIRITNWQVSDNV